MTQQILQGIQNDLGPEQICSARLLPVSDEDEAAPTNGKAALEDAKAAVQAVAESKS